VVPGTYLRYRVRRDSHFDYFLERSQAVEGRLVFTAQTAEDRSGALAAAARQYQEQVAQRMAIVATLRNQENASLC
jgi:hypothetical protein